MTRLLVIPAAGPGSRLKAPLPKALVPVNGRPMLDHLAALYEPYVDYTVVIAHPSFSARIDQWADEAGYTDLVLQPSQTGMLDAILLAASAVARLRPDWIWITWCDQVAVLPPTLARLADVTATEPLPALAFPTVLRSNPYIHLVRDRQGHITEVLHRRERDVMPEPGESDMGVFALSCDTFVHDLHEYASIAAPGTATGERNFLPFIPWLAARKPVVTFPCTDPMEAVGINTPEELRLVERWLMERGR